jgi:hypothetical protein
MKGIKTGGRVKGSKNAFTYDIKAKLQESVNEDFVAQIFTDIEEIDNVTDRVKARIKLLEFFVSKAKDPEEVEKEDFIREKLLIALALK